MLKKQLRKAKLKDNQNEISRQQAKHTSRTDVIKGNKKHDESMVESMQQKGGVTETSIRVVSQTYSQLN